jgi:hypothetical protein
MTENLDQVSVRDAVEALEALLVAVATGGKMDEAAYSTLRRRLLESSIAPQLPAYVRTSRNLSQFWAFIKKTSGYADRRTLLWNDFGPILASLDGETPADNSIGDALHTLDRDEVLRAWHRAVERRLTDPDGAITAARTLLESTCKHLLDELGVAYGDTADLPKLYRTTAKSLHLAPDQHTEEVFRQILGGCQAVVEGLGAMRNRLSDAHGRGKHAAKPAPRHAELAVNLAGAMATFLVDTWLSRKSAR